MPLDQYESHAASIQTIVSSLRNSVVGWPLVAMALTMVAALSCLLFSGSHARICLIVPLSLAGAAMVVWAVQPAAWALCLDYRYWVLPFSLPLMTGAAVEELWLRRSAESQLQEIRRHAVSLIGAIFFLVLSIQSLPVGLVSQRLANELMNYDHGCVSRRTITSVRNTALDFLVYGSLRGRVARSEAEDASASSQVRVPAFRARWRRHSHRSRKLHLCQTSRAGLVRFRGC